MSDAISTGYVNKPAFTLCSLLALSLNECALASIGYGVMQFKYHINSHTSGMSDCR